MPNFRLKSLFFAALVVLSAVANGQTLPSPPVLPDNLLPGLRDILHRAIQQSPQMILHDIDLAQQEANRYQQASVEWPTVTGGFGYVDYHTATTFGKTFNSSSASSQGPVYNFTLSQPLYHWGALKAQADIAHLQIKISERQYAAAYSQLATMIRSQYLILIMLKVQVRNIHLALDQAKTAYQTAQEKFKNKAIGSAELDGGGFASR